MIKEVLVTTLALLRENKELKERVGYLEWREKALHEFYKVQQTELLTGETWASKILKEFLAEGLKVVQCFQDAEEGKTSGSQTCPKKESPKEASEKNF